MTVAGSSGASHFQLFHFFPIHGLETTGNLGFIFFLTAGR
jgi:hypothetical protein